MRSIFHHSLACSLLAAIVPALASMGCSGSASRTGAPVTSTVQRDLAPDVPASDEASLVKSNTGFAFGLYHELSTLDGGTTTSNLFYSPYSVSLALAMAYAGAAGETATQMAHALEFTLPEERLNPAFDKLDLAIEAKPSKASGVNGAPFALTLADSLWGDEHVTFGQPVVDTLSADYGAPLRTVDFLDQPSQAEAAINEWVATETFGKISPLIPPGGIISSTELVIVNAVYFNAAWASQFQKSGTQTATFTRADGSTVQTPMMGSSSVATSYFKGSNYQAVDLPYSGATTSMVVVLPDKGAYAAVEKVLSESFYASVTSSLAGSPVVLTMPRFTIHGPSVKLNSELEALGMTDAFGGKADFNPIVPGGGIYINWVIHQAFVDVDENGTQAAAATAVSFVDGAASLTPTPEVDLTGTFFFFIRDIATNTVLFVGRENDPTAQ
jgi:serpin B